MGKKVSRRTERNRKKGLKKGMVVAVAAMILAGTPLGAKAAEMRAFNFYLNPGESDIAANTITKDSTVGYAKVKTTNLANGAQKITYTVLRGSNAITTAKTITTTGTVQLPYNSTPGTGVVIKLQGSLTNASAPVVASGQWNG